MKYGVIETRTCKTCKEDKPLTTKFFIHYDKLYFSRECKDCLKIKNHHTKLKAHRKWRANNKDKEKEYASRPDVIEKNKASQRRYNARNRKTLKERRRKVYYANIELARKKSREYAQGYRISLGTPYINALLRQSFGSQIIIPNEITEVKRQQILLFRTLKEGGYDVSKIQQCNLRNFVCRDDV